MNLSMYKQVLTAPKEPKQKHSFFGNLNLFKQKLNPEAAEIRPSGGQTKNRLDYPFRFVPHVGYANDGVSAFQDLCLEETRYQAELAKAVATLEQLDGSSEIQALAISLSRLLLVTKDLKINDSPDVAIVSRAPDIAAAYKMHLLAYAALAATMDSIKKNSSKLAFELDGMQDTLARPFQRLLEYRYFLRRILKCRQHVCPTANCTAAKCPTKEKTNQDNIAASTILTAVVDECYRYFGMADGNNVLCAWEDTLDCSQCHSLMSVDSSEDNMEIDLHLTVPYCQPEFPMANLPKYLVSETFDAFPIKSDVKVVTLDRNKTLKVVDGTNNPEFTLNVFSDFVLITRLRNNIHQLLYPPMPLTHIALDLHMECLDNDGKTLYGLKISPFVMFLIRPKNIMAGGSLMNKILDLQNNQSKKSLFPAAAAKKKATACGSGTDRSCWILSKDGKTPAQLELRGTASPLENRKFESRCRPFVFSPASDGAAEFEWTKLSICNFSVQPMNGQIVLTFDAEDSGRNLLRGTISASTVFTQVSPKRLQFVLVDFAGYPKKIIVQVASADTLSKICAILQTQQQNLLLHQYWEEAESLPVDKSLENTKAPLSFTTQECSAHTKLMVQAQNRNWIDFGPVDTFFVFISDPCDPKTFRWKVQSALNPALCFLELDLGNDGWSLRADGENAIMVRIFSGKSYCDYRLLLEAAEQESIMNTILAHGKMAQEERKQAEEKKRAAEM
ncbi:hypothetical protein HDU91_006521, partial [Kappamyces sp. JEL0680]